MNFEKKSSWAHVKARGGRLVKLLDAAFTELGRVIEEGY